MEKAEIRKQILNARRDLTLEDCVRKSQTIHRRLLSIQPYLRAKVIMTYVSFGKEADTRDLIPRFIQDDKKVCVPRVTGDNLETIQISGFDDLRKGDDGFGLWEPKPHLKRVVERDLIDLILVPVVAFDANGGRVGYGRGFYDRFLKNIDPRKLYGLAFDFQEFESVPKEPHDVPIPTIITESRILICA